MALEAAASFLIAVGLPLWLAVEEMVHQARVWRRCENETKVAGRDLSAESIPDAARRGETTMSQAKVIRDAALEDLRSALRGELLLPQDVGFDGARQIFNAMIDHRPSLIARCAGAAAGTTGRPASFAGSVWTRSTCGSTSRPRGPRHTR